MKRILIALLLLPSLAGCEKPPLTDWDLDQHDDGTATVTETYADGTVTRRTLHEVPVNDLKISDDGSSATFTIGGE